MASMASDTHVLMVMGSLLLQSTPPTPALPLVVNGYLYVPSQMDPMATHSNAPMVRD